MSTPQPDAIGMLILEEVFPPFALRISCAPLELRVLRDDDLPELVELVRCGIHSRCRCVSPHNIDAAKHYA